MKYVFGPSTGETGSYGVGDLVEGNVSQVGWDSAIECFMIDSEPVYNVYEIDSEGKVDLCDVRDFNGK